VFLDHLASFRPPIIGSNRGADEVSAAIRADAQRRHERRSSTAPLFGVGWSNLLENYFMDLLFIHYLYGVNSKYLFLLLEPIAKLKIRWQLTLLKLPP